MSWDQCIPSYASQSGPINGRNYLVGALGFWWAVKRIDACLIQIESGSDRCFAVADPVGRQNRGRQCWRAAAASLQTAGEAFATRVVIGLGDRCRPVVPCMMPRHMVLSGV